MTWTPATKTDHAIARAVVLWIRTAKAAGYPNNNPDWWPSDPDIAKSALFERIRSGKEPLEYPPPVAFACPWYALVEDLEPHNVGEGPGWGPRFHIDGDRFSDPDDVHIFQYLYKIVAKKAADDLIVRDSLRETPYRFRLWHDPDWRSPDGQYGTQNGTWFLRIVEGAPA